LKARPMDLKKKIEEFILTEICEEAGLNIQHIEENEPLIDSGILDSLGILKLLSFFDEELDVDISGDEIRPENFVNIGVISELIQKYMGKD
jgi:acyl carrier protein